MSDYEKGIRIGVLIGIFGWMIFLWLLRHLEEFTCISYFHVGQVGADCIAPGVATLIRKKWNKMSYLYLDGSGPGYLGAGRYELVPDSKFWWGPWMNGAYDLKHYPMFKKIDAVEAFKLIRKSI
jgi:hypothetical protein